MAALGTWCVHQEPLERSQAAHIRARAGRRGDAGAAGRRASSGQARLRTGGRQPLRSKKAVGRSERAAANSRGRHRGRDLAAQRRDGGCRSVVSVSVAVVIVVIKPLLLKDIGQAVLRKGQEVDVSRHVGRQGRRASWRGRLMCRTKAPGRARSTQRPPLLLAID